ncbi:MAG: CDP-alcohol phosphatidyltransferase [Candidatus Peregrinibacteria bacterium GW2011_GWA2_33_10]|nr:MAG: CDP-alcohol phosphatidyltransferase [Candidatus Peregrinibacteria bacterium GW2011_GWA2_33_10]KKP39162.1 MAG: CDP-alcohol phosphatidyltransferase, CDP-diacylglycerol-glycerol-3-phosphate 3-phosphatidyltransferase [Candidatus Peregrinibacteria bacterium GW2011_GWC2_33_13]
MKSKLHTPANYITIFRLLLTIFAFYLVLSEQKFYTGIAILIIAPLDMLDGYIARKLKHSSDFGARLDSIGDYIGGILILYSLYIFEPEIFTDYIFITLTPIFIFLIYVFICLLKHKNFYPIHNYSGKFASAFFVIFTIYTLLFSFSFYFFLTSALLYTLNCFDKILIILLDKNKPDLDTKSFLSILK